MPTFRIETEGTAHEVYYVDAPSEPVARKMFNDGELTNPVVLEVEGAEIIEIREETNEDDDQAIPDPQPGSMKPSAHVYGEDPE